MIDLERVAKWTAIFSILWIVAWICHIYTMQLVRKEVSQLYLDVHTLVEEQDKGLDIESTANPQLDTLAWCLTHTYMKP